MMHRETQTPWEEDRGACRKEVAARDDRIHRVEVRGDRTFHEGDHDVQSLLQEDRDAQSLLQEDPEQGGKEDVLLLQDNDGA